MINKLINLIELKDKSACALMDYYINKGVTANREFQKYIDDVCDSMAKNFIIKYQEQFNNRQMQIEIFRYLDSLGVKQGHTGKRFSEALYRQLHLYINNQAKLELSK